MKRTLITTILALGALSAGQAFAQEAYSLAPNDGAWTSTSQVSRQAVRAQAQAHASDTQRGVGESYAPMADSGNWAPAQERVQSAGVASNSLYEG